jgi:hypothetical protein
MDEIDFRKAAHEDLLTFATNLLGVKKNEHPQNYEAQIAYFSTATQVGLGWRESESSGKLAYEIDQARSGVARGLEKLTLAIAEASDKSDKAAVRMEKESARMVKATWGLVGATLVLALVTVFLVIYTRQLAIVEAGHPPTTSQSTR